MRWLVGLAAVVAAGGPAASQEQVYRQLWKSPGGDWQAIGLMTITAKPSGPVVAGVPFSYTARDAVPPATVSDVTLDDAGLKYSATFPFGDKSTTLVFALARTGDTFAGPVTRDGKPFADTKLELVPTPAAVRAELERVVAELKVEKKTSERLLPQMRENLKGWEDRLDMDRRHGRSTTGTTTALYATTARATLGFEESRILRLEGYLTAAIAATVRAEAAEAAAKK